MGVVGGCCDGVCGVVRGGGGEGGVRDGKWKKRKQKARKARKGRKTKEKQEKGDDRVPGKGEMLGDVWKERVYDGC